MYASTMSSALQVNAVIGDLGVLHSRKSLQTLDEEEHIQTHLLFVCDYLASVPTYHLNTQQKINRRLVVNALRCYAREGIFPQHNESVDALRRPRFIDHRGVHCAVGELIKYTDGGVLPEQINQLHEYDYIPDIHVAEVAIWAYDNGLTLDECAMIQPSYIDYGEILKELCPWVALSKGTDLEARTEALRRFRDQRLKASVSGRLLVKTYYKAGPGMVRFFAKHPWSQEPARKTLDLLTRNLK
ncbi:MAG: hypothetical protein D9N11_10710 [Ketobacter sp.]|nr:MAG: hypothetical protein D9N11_10710 [Ketobacter sp.]